ncbi:MAG TPA: hypothetical protein VNQ78_13275 [Paracoccus sp. (in: a-proteobacteria)]|uniref:hypothetical protein n=1 Tax=Paracoccus sp. TaxID=267 RepID=UPI002CFA2A1D|nr:hypothetical protein [Paracoccus sp. (in: a-proteobacteria)]HWL57626.1 hypothetical protein [Paracoccus sp. (in: a-proteobacteria)]
MGYSMQEEDEGPGLGPELDKALAELLDQTRREPISPRLRELAERLARALEKARQ